MRIVVLSPATRDRQAHLLAWTVERMNIEAHLERLAEDDRE